MLGEAQLAEFWASRDQARCAATRGEEEAPDRKPGGGSDTVCRNVLFPIETIEMVHRVLVSSYSALGYVRCVYASSILLTFSNFSWRP